MTSTGRAPIERRWLGVPLRAILIAGAVWLGPGPAVGQDPGAVAEAQRHFERGVSLVDQKRFEEAAVAFERAYEARPHPRVLYNIGLAHAAGSAPVRALDALERYLAQTADPATSRRRKRAQEIAEELAPRIATVEIRVHPSDASVEVDGRSWSAATNEPMRLLGGKHTLRIHAPGYRSRSRSIDLVGGEKTQVSVRLEPLPTPAPEPSPGQIQVACALPGVSVAVDGEPVGRTPVSTTIVTAAGSRQIAFHRIGYRFPKQVVDVRSNRTTQVDCGRAQRLPLHPKHQGTLEITTLPGARVTVDDMARRADVTLPEGPHRVEVSREGYHPWTRVVTVWPGQRTSLHAGLVPTPSTRARLRAERRVRRTWATCIGAAGVAFGAGTLLHYRWNDGRHEAWEREQRELDRAWLAGPPYASGIQARQAANDDAIGDIRHADHVTVALGVAAGTLLTTGIPLWFSGGNDEPVSAPVSRRAPWGWGTSW